MAVASLVLGALGALASLYLPLFFLGAPFGVLGIAFGVVALGGPQPPPAARRLSLAGMGLGALGMAVGLIIYHRASGLEERVERSQMDPELTRSFRETFRTMIQAVPDAASPAAATSQ
jgi:hypothetical protein